jgi:hypothetical protein
MKRTILAVIATGLLIPLTGCIHVERDDEPEAVSTTTTHRTISTTAPTTATVERTTVY